MKNRIAFICLSPWEILLSHRFLFHVREYYDWFCEQIFLMNEKLDHEERIEIYGETIKDLSSFSERGKGSVQVIYAQCSNPGPLKKVLEDADILVIGMSASRKMSDGIFLSLFPWKEKSFFLWDGREDLPKAFFEQCKREYLLREDQVIQTKAFCHLGRRKFL